MTSSSGRKGKRSDQAVWCEQHNRRECSKNTKRGTGRCHMVALAGLDNCGRNGHGGESLVKAKARGQANLLAKAFVEISKADYVDHGDVMQWALTRAYLRALWTAEQIRELGAKGAEMSDEKVRILIDIEQSEAREAARVAKMAADSGIAERHVRLAERTAEQLVSVLRGVVTELGHDAGDPKVQGVVERHLRLVSGGKG